MIPNQWYGVVFTTELAARPLALRRFGLDLVLWRGAEGRVVCMLDRCPHRGVKLSLGEVVQGQLRCGYHGFRFNAAGACTALPCEGGDARIPRAMCAVTFACVEAHGLVWVWWGEDRETYPEVPWFEGAPADDAAWARMSAQWPQNYVRSIETNFDGSHFVWVHGNVLPGVGARVDPVESRIDGDIVDTTLYIRGDKGAGLKMRVRFVPPNLSIIEVADKALGVVVDTPVDAHTTIRLTQMHQRFVNVPGLKRLVAWLVLRLDWGYAQARQDRPLVETMQPRLPVRGDHHLVKADAGIAAYRTVRRRLLEAAQTGGALPAHVAAALEATSKAQSGDAQFVLERSMFRHAAERQAPQLP